ncbi:nucleotide exchange factor GrpE [Candidatus Woesebacteria bacterium]|nr:nucleotide exchange factor GrpE [Candidatus Woesebacteria bacterium]
MTDSKNYKQAQESQATEGTTELETKLIELSEQLVATSNQLAEAKRREQLALADYQNLVRRTNEERGRVARLAARNFVDGMLQPLSHLTLAGQQLNDAGLNMVIGQLWQSLEENGLKKIDALGKDFDVSTMEAVEKGEHGKKVLKIVRDGYVLNDEVIQHAKVILD